MSDDGFEMNPDDEPMFDLTELIEYLHFEVPRIAEDDVEAGVDDLGNVPRESLERKWVELLMEQWKAACYMKRQRRVIMKALEDDDAATALHAALATAAIYGQLIDDRWRMKQLRPQANLRSVTSMIPDKDILAVIADQNYPTRTEQANKLGISLRYLQARIKRLKERGLIE